MPAASRPVVANLALFLIALAPLARCAQQSEANSTPPDTSHILSAMRDYAESYVSKLPNFLCLQTTDQFEAGKKGDHWKQLDSFTSRLLFADGEEHRTLQLVNGHKPNRAGVAHRPLTTNGEFAILISNIFSVKSAATFVWQGFQAVGGERCAVFRYRIEQDHSTMKLGLSDLATAIVAYGGLVFGDPETGEIRRVTSEANEIPPKVRTKSIATVIDYGRVRVGVNSYFLPAAASVEVNIPSGRIRNELHFSNYQKFEAESTVTFDSESTPVRKRPPPNEP